MNFKRGLNGGSHGASPFFMEEEMKKFVLCLGMLVNLEAEASTVADTWEQWNPLSRLWAQEQVGALEEAKNEEAPAEVLAGCVCYQKKDNKKGIFEFDFRVLVPTYIIECVNQWFVKLRQGDPATIGLIVLGCVGSVQLIRTLFG